MTNLVVVLLVYIALREVLFLYQVHKLLNKLMSRNYHEYTLSEKYGKLKEPQRIKAETEEPEDLGALEGIV
jgi:predicted permease